MSVLSLDEAADLTRTGDVWLFRGHSAADQAIRTLTNAPVNHVGMAVVLDDLEIFFRQVGDEVSPSIGHRHDERDQLGAGTND